MRRRLPRIVFDLSGVDAVGGGSARLLREFVAERDRLGWRTAFYVTSSTVRGFLSGLPETQTDPIHDTLEQALAAVGGGAGSTQRETHPDGVKLTTEAHELKRLLNAIGLEGDAKGASEGFVEDDAWSPEQAAAGARDVLAEEVATRLVRALCRTEFAARVHVFALQADGAYYPVSRHGVDFDRGFPYHGTLARRLREQGGPCLLDDLCTEPLTDTEEAVLTELNCEVVHATGGGASPEMLLFLSKERPGDEYTLDELRELEQIVDAVMSEQVDAAAPPDAAATSESSSEPSGELAIRTLLGAPAHQENEREHLLRRKVAQLRDILHLTRGFDAAFGTSRILDVLVLSVVSVARSDTILYFSERAGEYTLTHHRGLRPEALPEMRLRSDSTLARVAQQSEEPLQIAPSDRVTEEEKLWARQHGFQWLVPFRSKERALGLLLLGGTAAVEPDLEILAYLLHEAAVAYERALLHETLQDRTLGVVRGLITLIENRAGYDQGSTERVVRYTQELAREIHFPMQAVRDLIYGAVLRDVGMLRIDQAVLDSTGQLSADEWEEVRRHPIEGATIMRQMRFSDIAIEVVMHHHEAYNGEGYPMGLRGRAIPLGARLVSVAESYVKMTMDRPYRKALGRVEALESLAENWGLRYDPLVVDALVRVVNRELSMGLRGEVDFTRDLFGV
ncbi:MAG: HD domain-containing protein [Candidatus Latescibacterota bacterium]|nr:MAG: HD domain-containing protein [Candidatus Latescibacterota bacterium]